MTFSPARLALVHGPPAFSATMATILGATELQVRPVSTADDLAEALASRAASVVVVDVASLAGLESLVTGAGAGAGTCASASASASKTTGECASESVAGSVAGSVPFVAVGCADAAEVERALAGGAWIAARADATAAEVRRLVVAAAVGHELSKECACARTDLARSAALLVKDDLTAAYNRRFFDRFLGEQLENARASGGSVGLIFMDIDNLKAVNVKHGHSMGSLVLREAAGRLMKAVGAEDRVMRYGGDEFCIVLPGRDAKHALVIAEAVRRAFAATPFAQEATGGVLLTASFGIACCPEHATDASSLVRAADAAMLAIKDHKDGIQLAGVAGLAGKP